MSHSKGSKARRNEQARADVEQRRLVADLHLRLGRMTVRELLLVLRLVAQLEAERTP